MDVKEVDSWEQFEQELKNIREELGAESAARLLFRGQGNSEWRLETTLERHGQKRMSFSEFYLLICAIGPAVDTFTSMSIPEYDEKLRQTFTDPGLFHDGCFPTGQIYSYMIYLRHHGFPSPLLDWSKSPYVAAFFAFKDMKYDQPDNPPKRSIYAYCDWPGLRDGGRVIAETGDASESTIYHLGTYVQSHRRHFRQQSAYTICPSFDEYWKFDSHQDVFNRNHPGQDYLRKFDLPSVERIKVLRSLDDYNLNAFSLFDSEENSSRNDVAP
jgi:hypothetical protein